MRRPIPLLVFLAACAPELPTEVASELPTERATGTWQERVAAAIDADARAFVPDEQQPALGAWVGQNRRVGLSARFDGEGARFEAGGAALAIFIGSLPRTRGRCRRLPAAKWPTRPPPPAGPPTLAAPLPCRSAAGRTAS